MQISVAILVGGCNTALSYISNLIKSFKKRVFADTGLFEAEICLKTQLDNLNRIELLKDASLIITPNAVKESKLYSIIPSNGNGDMTVARATTATRVNELGLIEFTPYNLLNYSENFSNIIWQKLNGSSISLNTNYTNPSGGSSTYKYTASNLAFGGILRQQSTLIIAATTYTFSFFCKKDNYRYIGIRFNTSINAQRFPNYDFDTDTLNTQGAIGVTLSRELFSNGWVRLVLTYTSTTTVGTCDIGITSPNGATEIPLIGGESVYIWGAQLVQGSVPKDYFYTTDRLNVPRLNYDSVGGCPSILVEPQRTNLLLNSVWAGGGTTPTSWTTGIQTGTCTPVTSIKNLNVSAYRFITSNTRQEFLQTFSLILNQVIAFSCYVESATTAIPVNQMLRIGPIATANGTVVFLKNNVVITSTTNIEAGFTYSAVLTCTVSGDFQFRIGSGVNSNIIGDITLSMPQVELGTGSPSIASYSTSFIPTTIQAITRNTDVITRNNIYTNGLITSLGGTWFIELNNNFILTRDAIGNGIWIGDNNTSSTTGNSLNIRHNGGTARLNINKCIAGSLTGLYATITNTIKIAIDWNGTTADVFVNGVKVVTGTSFTTTNMEFLNSSAVDVQKYIKSMILFPKPLTDSECIALTTL